MLKYVLLFVISITISASNLNDRPLPKWFDEAKFGIFIHWGVYSVPGIETEWFWWFWQSSQRIKTFMKQNYPPGFTYQDFAKDFTAEFFDPNSWADLFVKSGAKYVVLTTKHHDGFHLWPSKYSFGWNSKDVGPHRDIVRDLEKAIRNRTNLRFGVYHSLREWFHPLFLSDKRNNFRTDHFVTTKILPESKELVNEYKPDIFWSDGGLDASVKYWHSEEFLTWLYEKSPVKDYVVANERWGTHKENGKKYGDFSNFGDNFNPGVLIKEKWESDTSVDKYSFGIRRNAHIGEYRSTPEIIALLVKTVSCGGNLLLNIGPYKDGTISPIFQERLLEVGSWLKINGEAIYNSKPWKFQKDNDANTTWYTQRPDENVVYVLFLKWPRAGEIILEKGKELFIENNTGVTLLGRKHYVLKWFITNCKVHVKLPSKQSIDLEWAWTLKIKP